MSQDDEEKELVKPEIEGDEGTDDPSETKELPAVDEPAHTANIPPALAVRAAKCGIDPEEMQELGPKALEKTVAVMERKYAESEKKNDPAAKETPADDDDEFDPERYDEKLVKFAKNTKGQMGQLRDTVARLGAREAVADLLEDDTTVPSDLRTRKAINAITEEMNTHFNKNPNAKWDEAYNTARDKVLGEKIKAAAASSRKPTATTPPAQKSKEKLSQYELTRQRILQRNPTAST